MCVTLPQAIPYAASASLLSFVVVVIFAVIGMQVCCSTCAISSAVLSQCITLHGVPFMPVSCMAMATIGPWQKDGYLRFRASTSMTFGVPSSQCTLLWTMRTGTPYCIRIWLPSEVALRYFTFLLSLSGTTCMFGGSHINPFLIPAFRFPFSPL